LDQILTFYDSELQDTSNFVAWMWWGNEDFGLPEYIVEGVSEGFGTYTNN